jgi:hypothetical protein
MITDVSFTSDYCFEDLKLHEYIRDNGEKGNCAWCRSKNRFIVSLNILGPLFCEVAIIYEENDFGGDNISYLLHEDWSVFSEAITEAYDDRMWKLCVAILEAGFNPSCLRIRYTVDSNTVNPHVSVIWKAISWLDQSGFSRATSRTFSHSSGSIVFQSRE